MYLVDTSVWIDSLRQNDNAAVRIFKWVLDRQMPFGITSAIYQEVLQGARTDDDFNRLRDYLGTQRFYHPEDPVDSYAAAANLFRVCRRNGLTIRSTLDCLIAQLAIEHDLTLIHNDRDFTAIAQVVPGLKLAAI